MPAPRLFLDAGGHAPVTPRAAEAFRAGLADGWADPARLYAEGRTARALVDGAREAIAAVLGAPTEYVHFTPSVALAFERVTTGIAASRRGRDRIAVTAVERDALTHAAVHVAGDNVDVIAVDAQGRAEPESVRERLTDPATALAAVQHANQEIGTVQDLETAGEIARAAGTPLVVDATSSIGHIEAPEHWDALIAEPANWGAPAGLGVVALQPRTRWLPAWPEATDPWSPDGVNVPLALAAAVALQERMERLEAEGARLTALTQRLRDSLAALEGVTVVGDPVDRLPHVVTAAFLYLDGEPLVTRLDREGISVGTGSACGKASYEPSKVLASIGALTHGNLRLGLHPGVTDTDIGRFLATLPRIVEDVRTSMTS